MLSNRQISSYRHYRNTSRQIEIMYGYKSNISINETKSWWARTCNTDMYRTFFTKIEKINGFLDDKILETAIEQTQTIISDTDIQSIRALQIKLADFVSVAAPDF